MIATMVLAGYAGAPWWVALAGAAGLTLDGWWGKLRLLLQAPRTGWSTKVTAYFVTGIAANGLYAGLAWSAGRLVRSAM